MRSLSGRLLLSLCVLFLPSAVFAHSVTVSGTNLFTTLDGSLEDHDGLANGVFTVSDGDLIVNGTIACNDDSGRESACSMAFNVSGDVIVNAGGAIYAENRTGSGTGGAITFTAGRDLTLHGPTATLAGAIVSSASRSSGRSSGGAITANVSRHVTLAAGSTIDAGSPNGRGGNVLVAASGAIRADGNVYSGPSRTLLASRLDGGAALDGAAGNSAGGDISLSSSTFVEPAVVIGSNANVVSQGEQGGAGTVIIEGCGIQVRGLVAALSRKDSAAKVVIRSGKDVVIDARDLGVAGATLGRNGRLRADAPSGTAASKSIEIFAAETIDLLGPVNSTLFAVTSLAGAQDANSQGGVIRVISTGEGVNASGNVADAGRSHAGSSGGTIEISTKADANLHSAVIRSFGDSSSGNPARGGGAIRVRSYSGNVVWTSGFGDVRPSGSASRLPAADQGVIDLQACGTINLAGSSFPTNGAAVGPWPSTATGVCSPGSPALPAGTPSLVTCNTPPVANDSTASTNEDNSVTVTLTGSDVDGDSLTFSVVTGPSNGTVGAVTVVNATTSTVVYTPNGDYNGSDSFTFQADDGNGGTDTGLATISIAPVNDAPSFLAGPTVSALEDAAAQTYANWASAISAGPGDESAQTVTFSVTNDDHALFSVQPAVAADGTLTWTPAPNAYGSTTITVTATDDGGTANGGTDTSAPQTVTITVNGVNDAPSFAKGSDQTVAEDAGAQSVANWATAISAGPNETQNLTFHATNSNNALFSVQPSVAADGTLSYTAAADANGSATVTVTLADDGGTANGGVDTSAAQSFTITVTAVNDDPSFTSGGNVSVLEDSGAYSAAWATGISAGPADESAQTLSFSTSNDNNALFAAQPSLSSTGALAFTPAANAYGSATVTVTLSDNAGGGSAAQTFTITVDAVNDAPSFSAGSSVTVNEDSAAYSASWASGISAGPGETQNVAFSVSNGNNALFSTQPSVSPAGVLAFALAANANGSATVTVTLSDDGGTANGGVDTSAAHSFTITVTAVNDDPSFTSGGNVSVLEDSGAYSAAWATGISAGPADESAQTVSFSTSNDNGALFAAQPSVSSTGALSFTPAANAYGTATVTVTLSDNAGGSSAAQTFTVTVGAVNDAPSFSAGGNVTRNEDSGAYSASWANGISAGPGETQNVAFFVSNDNNALFSAQPSVSSSGVLSFALAANANGSATVTVALSDDGGTANGGVDTSAAQTFTITVNAANDAPSFTSGGDVAANEDSGAYSAAWASAVSAGAADESAQTVTFTVFNNNNALFSVQPAVAADGTLTFTTAANAFGSATVTVQASDNGGTANGGADTSAPQSFTITIHAVNDAPGFTSGGNVTAAEDSGAYAGSWATGINAGPGEAGQALTFNVTNSNSALFAVQPSVSSNGVLSFTAASDANGTATVTVSLSDDGGTANGGVDTSASVTFVISISAVNDAPSFVGGGDQTVLEDSGTHTVNGWASSISAGPADEAGQSVTFAATASNPALFSVQPAVSPAGDLTFSVAANAFGSTTVSLVAHDSDGSASAAHTFTITINGSNDAPSFVAGGDVAADEDAGAQSINWATSISAGPGESGQVLTFSIVGNTNPALFSAQPAVSSSGVLTFTSAANAFGTASITLHLSDDGGTANGGTDTSASVTFTININPINEPPSAAPDAYDAIGNTLLQVAASQTAASPVVFVSGSVLSNDTDIDSPPASLTASLDSGSVTGGASVTMNADGTFTYLPPAGYSAATDSFTYTVSDGFASATGTVVISFKGRVWYVRNNGPSGSGRSNNSFAVLSEAQTASASGDTIFVYAGNGTTSGQNAGFALKHNQRLIGEGVALTVPVSVNGGPNPTVLLPAGVKPKVTNGGGSIVTAANVSNVTVAGLDLSNAPQDGIRLTNVNNASVSTVTIANNLGNGIAGTTVSGFALSGSTLDNNGDDGGADEAGIRFDNLTGTASIANTTVANSIEDNVRVMNTSGSLTLTISGTTVRDTETVSPGNNGLLVDASGTASVTLAITSSSFLRNRANGVQVNSGPLSTGTVSVTIDGGTFQHNNVGVNLAHAGAGSFSYDVKNGTVTGQASSASPISVNMTSSATGPMTGSITGNVITNADSSLGAGIRVVSNGISTLSTRIDGNNISQVANRGIDVLGRSGSNAINVAIVNNTVNLGAAGADAIRIDSGAQSADTVTVCAEISNNVAITGGAGMSGVRVRQRFAGTTFRLKGYGGVATDNSAVASFLSSTNNGATALADHGGSGFQTTAGCAVP